MKVVINKREISVSPEITTLEELLAAEKLSGPGRAVAVDNKIVRNADRAATQLREGMQITVIRAVCGG